MHGSRTHQSVRNVKSTRGYVRADVNKGQRGMMGIDRFFFHVTHISGILNRSFGSLANIYAHLQILLKIQ